MRESMHEPLGLVGQERRLPLQLGGVIVGIAPETRSRRPRVLQELGQLILAEAIDPPHRDQIEELQTKRRRQEVRSPAGMHLLQAVISQSRHSAWAVRRVLSLRRTSGDSAKSR